MRLSPLSLLCFALLPGCSGNIADRIGPREGIVSPELTRYGLNLRDTSCVSEHLAGVLTPVQLRRLRTTAGTVKQGYFDPDRLSLRDLSYVASQMEDAAVAAALAAAVEACGATAEEKAPGPSEPAASSVETPAAPNWLNLGKAESGQGIAVDASSIEREGAVRRAWFRLFDPDGKPSDQIFLLQVDCTARTIDPRKERTLDAAGAVLSEREFPSVPTPLEQGTVTAVAYLSLCT